METLLNSNDTILHAVNVISEHHMNMYSCSFHMYMYMYIPTARECLFLYNVHVYYCTAVFVDNKVFVYMHVCMIVLIVCIDDGHMNVGGIILRF